MTGHGPALRRTGVRVPKAQSAVFGTDGEGVCVRREGDAADHVVRVRNDDLTGTLRADASDMDLGAPVVERVEGELSAVGTEDDPVARHAQGLSDAPSAAGVPDPQASPATATVVPSGLSAREVVVRRSVANSLIFFPDATSQSTTAAS